MRLTEEELSFFKTWGYLLKKRVLKPALIEQALDRLWEGAPPSLARDDPGTWAGPIPESEEDRGSLLLKHGYRWQDRTFGTDESTLALTVGDQDVVEMAQQLLGEELLQPTAGGEPMGTRGSAWPGGPVDPAGDGNQGARGVYVTLPQADPDHKTQDFDNFWESGLLILEIQMIQILVIC